jgi:hypothetical protein
MEFEAIEPPGAFAELGVQIHREGQQDARHERHEPRVAYQAGQFTPQGGLDMARVKVLEGAVARGLEQDQDRHELARAQPGSASATPFRPQSLPLPQRLKLSPKRIHRAVQVEYTHDDASKQGPLSRSAGPLLRAPCVLSIAHTVG